MDSEEVKKKFFDIAPPATAPTAKGAPALKPAARKIMTTEAPADDAKDEQEPVQVVRQTVIQPLSETEKETPEVPAENTKEAVAEPEPTAEQVAQDQNEPVADETPEPTTEETATDPADDTPSPEGEPTQPAETSTEPEEEQAPESEPEQATETPIIKNDAYGAIDALPDPDQKRANETAEGMQDPKVYDTKEYHVAIKESHHKHGSLGVAFTVGAIFAIAVAAAAAYYFGNIAP